MKLWVIVCCCVLLSACVSTPRTSVSRPAARTRLPADNDRAEVQRTMKKAARALRDARLTDAEILYRQLTQTHPNLPEVWLRLGNVYMREAQLQAAVRTYTQGLRHDRNDGRLWYNLALARLKQSVDTLETSSKVLPADSAYRPQIRALHSALLEAGQS
ncbi:tetratricopeptide repeat protein [Salinisphaera sp.]|uniref:tetratricopeptide repeat protein n=1 Tax=Salinisphaera sp. TaxID=1914330 RepID=UPI002D7723AD|nr:tetratricopeptide repeat protein [Salinisphaera sp.]HET7314084.1 tetratricopeptide repeat protein [Salinisphaera sp.]